MGPQQPYLYDVDRRDSRFPEKEFDPKAFTRQSWEVRPKKPKHEGPFVSFGRHPDAQAVPSGSSTANVRPMSTATKWWILSLRKAQLGLRGLELLAGLGLLALMILISNVDFMTAWVMRIAPGVVAISCIYAIYHLSRDAADRPPGSSAAYQLFSGFTDLTVLPLYAFGCIAVANNGHEWTTLLPDETLLQYFVPAEYYTLIVASGLHFISLGISVWLGLMFRRIASMPPDMNPLENHLTARHKRNKSSIATAYTDMSEASRRLSTPLEDRRRSGAPYETLSRPPSIPFMHTRSNSGDSLASLTKGDSRADFPSRQYQITPGNSPRNSGVSAANLHRLSKPPTSSHRGSYAEVPVHETGAQDDDFSRPPPVTSPSRDARFTEAWYASESLINRTQERTRKMNAAERAKSKAQAYEALNQRYGADSDGEDSEQENGGRMMRPDPADFSDLDDDERGVLGGAMHPNPLRSNPTPASPAGSPTQGKRYTVQAPRIKTPFQANRESVLSEVSLNSRNASGSFDIAEQKPSSLGVPPAWNGRQRDSSIQPEEGLFYAKPYGDLKAATPPIMVGSGRQVSSGHDYDFGAGSGGKYRRNVSGKVAEEGRGGYSRYSLLNDD